MKHLGHLLAGAVAIAGLAVAGMAWAAAEGGVDHSALPDIPDGVWLSENPYRGNKQAMELGKQAYDGNCARCHGIDMISGGIAPDLRELRTSDDEYFLGHIRHGVSRAGITRMPAFEDVFDQETMWAIRSYIDKRHYEYKDKELNELYKQWDGSITDSLPDDTQSSITPRRPADARARPAALTPGAAARAIKVADDGDDGAGDRLASIQKAGKIEVAVYKQFPPWSYRGKTGYQGIDVDVAKALAERLDVSLNLRAFTPDETMGDDIRNEVWKGHYLNGEPADAMLHVGMAQAFQQDNDQASFLAPYYNETMGFAYSVKRFGHDIDSPLALAGHKLGVQLDTLGDYFLTSAYQGQLRDDVEHFDSVPAAMRALNQGQVAGVMAPVGELSGAVHMLDEQNVTLRTVKLTGLYQTNWNIGVAIKAGNPELADSVRKAMAAMRTDGTLKSIFEDYGVPYRAPSGSDETVARAAALAQS